MMNSIPHDQNSEDNLRLLAAQRELYGRAKHYAAFQVLVSFIAPAFAVFSLLPKPWIALTGLAIAMLDALVLDPGQLRRREAAAKVQETFDTAVLELPWNKLKVGPKPDPEDVHEAASVSLRRKGDTDLRDWYPAKAAEVPSAVARSICQRANVVWDSRLRARYRAAVAWIVALTSTAVLVVGLAQKLTVETMTITVLAPLTPLLLWSIREWQRESRAMESLKRLDGTVNEYVDDAVTRKANAEELDRRARLIQDEIYDRRRQNPLIFDWVYALLRTRFEEHMAVGAETLVSRYQMNEQK
jgi:hypothetical protein